MKRQGWLISKYLILAVLPYFISSWLLLSVILFVQQASRFSDIFFNVDLPASVVWQLTVALIPNVIAFTCPMALLVGTVIGLAKMQSDSELTAMRAAGVGNLQITASIAMLGIVLSGFAFLVNLEGVPLAAALVRRVALQTAIKKLESPIEPGTFNSDLAGYTVYVRSGDYESGQWKDIFIYKEESTAVRLITATEGRIDFSDQLSELVLSDAVVSTIPRTPGTGSYVSESLSEIRLAIKTRRSDLVQRLSETGGSIEELGLSELSDYAAGKEGRDRIEAEILWQRRILLSITPLLFSLLGTSMVLRFSRGGRGLGIFLALISLICYYLLAFLGEQLARTGVTGAMAGFLLPTFGSLGVVVWFYYAARAGQRNWSFTWLNDLIAHFRAAPDKLQLSSLFVDVTTGIRDLDIVSNLVKYFLLTLGFLLSVFLIFTAFDLWKYAGRMEGGTGLLGQYLLYLLPYIYIQIAPAAAMIATLATYAIKSRQNEIVTWASAGQSIYRLLMPCFIAAFLLGIVNWQMQERLLPGTNRKQDEARALINARGSTVDPIGRRWVAVGERIYAFEKAPLGGERSASDNEKRMATTRVVEPVLFEFIKDTPRLQTVYRSKSGSWDGKEVLLEGGVERSEIKEGKFENSLVNSKEFAEISNPFVKFKTQPNYLSAAGIREQIATSSSETERRGFTIALEKRYTTIVLPFVIALFSAPFAFSLSRKAKAGKIGLAIGLWLLFTGAVSLFEQFGLNGYLPASAAVWSPLLIFTMVGVYRLSTVRT